MKIEFRKSDENGCEACGATELILTSRGESLSADMADYLSLQIQRVEAELTRQFKEELVSLSEVVQEERKQLKAALEAAHREYEENVEAALGERARFYRPFKRRWQKQLDAEVARVTEELRDKTRRV